MYEEDTNCRDQSDEETETKPRYDNSFELANEIKFNINERRDELLVGFGDQIDEERILLFLKFLELN